MRGANERAPRRGCILTLSSSPSQLISTLNSHAVPSPAVGSLGLRLSNAAESVDYLEYITTSNVIFVKNYSDVCAKNDKVGTPNLDKYIAGYFAQTKIGTRLIRLPQLSTLGAARPCKATTVTRTLLAAKKKKPSKADMQKGSYDDEDEDDMNFVRELWE